MNANAYSGEQVGLRCRTALLFPGHHRRAQLVQHNKGAERMKGIMQWFVRRCQRQLQSKDAKIRKQAAARLGQYKQRQAVETLVVVLTGQERDFEVLHAVVKSLTKIGDLQAVPALVKTLQHHPDEFVRADAAQALWTIEGGGAREVLARALVEDGGNGVVRVTVAQILGEIGDVRAVEALSAALARQDKFEVLCTAAEGLGKIGGPQAIEALVRAANDSQVEAVVQQAAARALAFAQRR